WEKSRTAGADKSGGRPARLSGSDLRLEEESAGRAYGARLRAEPQGTEGRRGAGYQPDTADSRSGCAAGRGSAIHGDESRAGAGDRKYRGRTGVRGLRPGRAADGANQERSERNRF